MPEHLKALGYQNPKDPTNTALSRALGITGKVPTEIIFDGPHLNAFALYMGTFTQGHKEWTELYPVQERMIKGYRDGTPMLVDVGGGFGHQAQLLKNNFPDLPGAVIVQDLPQM